MVNIDPVYLVMLVAGYFAALVYLENNHCRKAFISNDEYLNSLAMVRNCSVYELFRCSGVDWRFSALKINADFSAYLKNGHIPTYVINYVRQHIRAEEVRSLRRVSRLW